MEASLSYSSKLCLKDNKNTEIESNFIRQLKSLVIKILKRCSSGAGEVPQSRAFTLSEDSESVPSTQMGESQPLEPQLQRTQCPLLARVQLLLTLTEHEGL